MRPNTAAFQVVCNKFPALENIESFSSGTLTTLCDVVAHLNPKNIRAVSMDLDDDGHGHSMIDKNKKAIIEQAKKGFVFYFHNFLFS